MGVSASLDSVLFSLISIFRKIKLCKGFLDISNRFSFMLSSNIYEIWHFLTLVSNYLVKMKGSLKKFLI